MTDPRNVWVLPHPYKGGWAIKREGAETFLDRYKSVARAIDSAREVARTLGGMLIVENEAGIITCENPGQPQLQHS